jgi:hypothetical protein
MLVGLRWWSRIKDDGSEEWIFESIPKNEPNKMDAAVFWGACYITPIIWIVLCVTGILSLDLNSFTMAFINVILGGCNLLGYVKC